jgi:hypothetical protein
MDLNFRQQFTEKWARYFKNAELPLAFFYTDQPDVALPKEEDLHCIIGQLSSACAGQPLVLSGEMKFCGGGKRYLGFSQSLRPRFEYFLSCGIPGEMEGERYKKTPELVTEQLKQQQPFTAPGKYLVFKRFDQLSEADEPIAVIFFAAPDVLAGLFTLTSFDEAGLNATISPVGSGCASIIQYPYYEYQSATPRAVLGMFDVSARPSLPAGELTFTIPWPKFVRMVENMDESFLITGAWERVRSRLP